MNRSTSKICPYCGGKGKIGITKYLPLAKMIKIMKKHSLTQLRIAELCGLSQAGVSNWFDTRRNTKGVKQAYFEKLAKKGYL